MNSRPSPFSDLFLLLLWTMGTFLCIVVPFLNELLLRVIFALPTILFIPGYVLVVALFPAGKDLDRLERVALSFGLSIAVVPLMGLALNYTPWGIRLEPILFSLILFITVMIMAAAYRRIHLAPEERFTVSFGSLVKAGMKAILPEGESGIDRILSVILALSILMAIGATVYVVVVPKEGEHFTEFYILGETGKAANYPRDIQLGKEYFIIIGIGNHEYRNVTYTVECHAMNITFDPMTNTSIENRMELLDAWNITIADNTTYEKRWNFSLSRNGFNRLDFLLFQETIPDATIWGLDRINASYRDLHLWIDILPS
jgi:uncharacterized membrane protein